MDEDGSLLKDGSVRLEQRELERHYFLSINSTDEEFDNEQQKKEAANRKYTCISVIHV